jgi:hypothetical protein
MANENVVILTQGTEEGMDERIVTSTLELKKRLLERAQNGQSRYSAAEMISLICNRVKRAKEIPPEHEKALEKVRGVNEPRSVMALNAIEDALGTGRRFTARPQELVCIMPESPTLN